MKAADIVKSCAGAEPVGPSRRGAILVLATLFLSIALVFTAFVTDIGYISLQQARVQSAADAAALGAAMDFSDGEEAVQTTIKDLLKLNGFDSADNLQLQVTATYGTWDEETREFVATPFAKADAVRVDLNDTGVQAFFGVAMGYERYTVGASAIAGRSGGPPLDVVLAIDCSMSMEADMANRKSRMDNANAAALRLIEALNDQDRLGLAVFSWRDVGRNKFDRTGIAETRLHFNKQPTESRIRQLNPGEYVDKGLGTNIGGGLRAGLDVFLNDLEPRNAKDAADTQRIMVLLTDGQVNLAEPYPTNVDETGIVPLPPFNKNYDSRDSVRRWAATIKARGIKLYVVTLSDEALDPLMVSIASPPDEQTSSYYYHVADGANDYLQLLEVFESIGSHGRKPKLLQ